LGGHRQRAVAAIIFIGDIYRRWCTMAEDRSNQTTGKPDKAPSPAPLPERVRAIAGEFGRAIKGLVTGGQEASPGDHAVPSHSPDATESGDASGEKARGKSPIQTPTTFGQRLEELRRSSPDIGHTLERTREDMEPECP
jgi:hypothetical protein